MTSSFGSTFWQLDQSNVVDHIGSDLGVQLSDLWVVNLRNKLVSPGIHQVNNSLGVLITVISQLVECNNNSKYKSLDTDIDKVPSE